LIASDTNCKIDFLNNKPNDIRTEKLLEYIFSNQLHVLNDSKKPTYLSTLGESHIDLTISSEQFLKHLTNWKIEQRETLSDHCYITFDIRTESNKNNFQSHINSEPKQYCYKKANWELFEYKFFGQI